MSTAELPYHEPDIITILILSSFLLLLNITNYVLDRIVYCGLIGQILVGVAWGVPGADWLSQETQNAVMQLGYLGLILVVYEGGLSTDLKTLKANLLLSATVAAIGISCPIGLSFVLQGLLDTAPLQAFAAGAALCSTSLGTTFTVLSTSGLRESRLGVVLSSAAMMDDVIGLVMVQVISNLGQSSSTFDAVTVVRPIMVSIAFAVVLPLVCVWAVKPLTSNWYSPCNESTKRSKHRSLPSRGAMFVFHTAVLVAMVAGSTYAGTSNLFAAYLAGVTITWWSGVCSIMEKAQQTRNATINRNQKEQEKQGETADVSTPSSSTPAEARRQWEGAAHDSQPAGKVLTPSPGFSGVEVYEHYYGTAVRTILKPFFFASIGFSIPITQMFLGAVVWRAFVFATLMALGKLLCGGCLVRFSGPPISLLALKRLRTLDIKTCWPLSRTKVASSTPRPPPAHSSNPIEPASHPAPTTTSHMAAQFPKRFNLPKPRSLYPAAILGNAMVARGEIGFLISSVAERRGIFGADSDGGSSELFLVVTWAILLCTIFGPVVVGLLVKRVKRLQEVERSNKTGREDPLGIWGVIQAS